MILVKIKPEASFSKENGPFTPATIIKCSYLTCAARPYVVGSEETRFEIIFGNVENNNFMSISSTSQTLTKDELKNWGTDDKELLKAICAKIGTAPIEYIEVPNSNF